MMEVISEEVLLQRLHGTRQDNDRATLHVMNVKQFIDWLDYHNFPKVRNA